jgi:hypothetical protein
MIRFPQILMDLFVPRQLDRAERHAGRPETSAKSRARTSEEIAKGAAKARSEARRLAAASSRGRTSTRPT